MGLSGPTFPNSPPSAANGGDQMGESTAERSEGVGGPQVVLDLMNRHRTLEIPEEPSTTSYPSPTGCGTSPLLGGLFREINLPK